MCDLLCPWPKCYHVFNWVFLPKPGFLGIYSNFQWQQKPLKNQYLPHFESKSDQINFINPPPHQDLSKKLQRHIPIPLKFSVTIMNLIFSEKIIQYSKTFWPKVQTSWNQSSCTLPSWELSKDTKNTNLKHPVRWIS